MDAVLECSAEKYLDSARRMLEKKDLLGFVENITSSILLSQQNAETLAKATYLKVEGLMSLKQHSKALEAIDLALNYNTDKEKVFHLNKYKGKAKGYLGYADEALKVFKNLLGDTRDIDMQVVVFLYIAWVYLTVDKDKEAAKLEEAKKYLDLAMNYFDEVPNKRKWRILNNYSIYYYYKDDYDKAIEKLEAAIEFCEEKDLPYVYVSLAEIYLEVDDKAISTAESIRHYTGQAEILGSKHKDDVAIARGFYVKAMSELKEEQLLTALDTLYMSLEYYKQAEAYSLAFDCLVKIYEIIDKYRIERLQHLKSSLNGIFKDTPLFKKLKGGE